MLGCLTMLLGIATSALVVGVPIAVAGLAWAVYSVWPRRTAQQTIGRIGSK